MESAKREAKQQQAKLAMVLKTKMVVA